MSVLKSLNSYRCQYSRDMEGDGLALVDVLTPSYGTDISDGKRELELLAEHISEDIDGGAVTSDIKIKYTVVKPSGFTFSKIFKLRDVEKGHLQTWLKSNYVGSTSTITRSVLSGV